MIATRLRRMKSTPALAVGALLFALPWWCVLIQAFLETLHGRSRIEHFHELLSCVGLQAFLPLLVWLACVISFRNSCGGARGWGRLLLRYHLCGYCVGAALFFVLMAVIHILAMSPLGRGMRPRNFLIPLLISGVAVLCIRRWLVEPHRRLMERIHILQRPAAIAALREEARERMRARGWPEHLL